MAPNDIMKNDLKSISAVWQKCCQVDVLLTAPGRARTLDFIKFF